MYNSILEKREQPVKEADFEEAPDLVFNFNDVSQRQDEYNLGLWERLIPYTPLQIYDLYTTGYDHDKLTVNVSAYENGRVEFEIDHHGDKGFLSRLEMRLGRGVPQIIKNKVVVDDDAQGQGIGRHTMRNWIETSAALGSKEFIFDADLDAGGLVWGKMGGHLDRCKRRNRRYMQDEKNFSQSIQARLETVRDYIGVAAYKEVHALCQLKNADDVVRIAQMGSISVPREAMEEAAPVMTRYFMDEIGNEETALRRMKREMENISEIFSAAGRWTQQYVTLPHYLLKKSAWAGVVHFSNDAQMEQVGDYLYGWQTLEPARKLAMA